MPTLQEGDLPDAPPSLTEATSLNMSIVHKPLQERTVKGGMESLSWSFPWPDEKPLIERPIEAPGWLGGGTELLLARCLTSALALRSLWT